MGHFIFEGLDMSEDFKDILSGALSDKVRIDVNSRKKKKEGSVYRNHEYVERWLKYEYKGDLPKSLYELAKKFYPKQRYIAELFSPNFGEDGYKNMYPKEYASFYADLSMEEKERVFHSCDMGIRSVYELKQDTVAGNIIEDMVCYHFGDYLKPNENASGRNGNAVSTICDLTYEDGDVRGDIELKVSMSKRIKDCIYVKKSKYSILNDGDIYLMIYPYAKKAVLMDPTNGFHRMDSNDLSFAGGKSATYIYRNENDIVLDYSMEDPESNASLKESIKMMCTRRGEK